MTTERTPNVEVESYTPTTEQVRNNMAFGAACAAMALQVPDDALADAMRDIDWPSPGVRPRAKAQFDAWLAAHDAEVLAAADAVQREGLHERVAEVLREVHGCDKYDPEGDHRPVPPCERCQEQASVVAAFYGGRP